MSKEITISDELYRRLQAQAQARGLAIEQYISELQEKKEKEREREFRESLRAKGLLVTWPDPVEPPAEFEPVEVKGAPLSQTVIEDRR